MATIPTDVQKRIDDMYNQQRNTQLGELRAEQQKATQGINQQKTETGQQYYDKRNQADVTNFQNRRALQEMMAAQGLSRSGENISGQVGLNSARQNVLGGLNREEQNIMGSLNQRINEINDPSRANSITSAIESQRSAALAEALDRAIERQRQEEQARLARELQERQFQAQMEAERLSREEQIRQFNQKLAWDKEQFNRQLAEQAARAARSGGGSRGSSSSSKSSSKNKSLADLYSEYQASKGTTNLNTLQKRSSVPARKASKSIGELLAERKFGGASGGRYSLSPN